MSQSHAYPRKHRKKGPPTPLARAAMGVLFLALSLAGCLAPVHRAPAEPGSGAEARVARRYMVAAANPYAARAGIEILEEGGSALDAAVAMQMVLGLVEPQSSGIGGGAFLLHWEAGARRLQAYDGRETAPATATPDLFLDGTGAPLPFWAAVVGGRSVGVPGVLRMLELAHRRHGRLPWSRLFQPAIALAEKGFRVSPRLHRMIEQDRFLGRYAPARRYFFHEDGSPRRAGDLLRNPELAGTLRRVAEGGADAFYTGPLAEQIVSAVRGAEGNPGRLSAADLAGYRALERTPLCRPYREWRVCGVPPPTSGGVGVLQILGLLERFDLKGTDEVERVHLFAEAGRLAYADRDRYLADPDFVPVPVPGLLDRRYLSLRSALIDPVRDMGEAEAGVPPPAGKPRGKGAALEIPCTSHLCVVDAQGNAVSMTTSVESPFGSRLWVAGFLLNNQLTDFSFVPERDGAPVANQVEPGKRPRSSMAPTAAFGRDGQSLVLVVGSPGGSRIIAYVAQALIQVLDLGQSARRRSLPPTP